MPDVITPPITRTSRRYDYVCLQCGRVAGHVEDGARWAITPEYHPYLAHMRCPVCRYGRLYQETEGVPVIRVERRVTAEEGKSNQGRRRAAPIPACIPTLCMRPGPTGAPCSLCRTRATRQRQRQGVGG